MATGTSCSLLPIVITIVAAVLSHLDQVQSSLVEDPCPEACKCTYKFNESIVIECSSVTNITSDIIELLRSPQHYGTLHTFRIKNIPFGAIPPELCVHKELHYLGMVSAGVKTLDSECLKGMNEIQELRFFQNAITELPDSVFDGMDKMRILDLSSNAIERIGTNVFANSSQLFSLDQIYMRYNKLKSLDPWPLLRMVVAKNVTIDLENNEISAFTNHLGWQYTCDAGTATGDIELKHNNITRLSDIQHGWYLSRFIDLVCLFSKSKDFHAELEDNPYHCDCKEYEIIRVIHNMGSRSVTVSRMVCHTPPFPGEGLDPSIVQIPLIKLVCHMQDNCPKGCTCLERPHNKTLQILCENLESLDETPVDYPRPYWNYSYSIEIQMHNNKIKELEDRSYYHMVTMLDVSSNRIKKVSATALMHLQSADLISLHSNSLSTLPKEIVNITHFRGRIGLHQNPWECSCHTLWLKHWMLSLNASLLHPEGILCGTPQRLHSVNMLKLPDDQYICGDPPNYQLRNWILIASGSVLGTILLLAIPLTFVYRFRVKLYARFHLRLFDWDECDGEDKIYDVFISYAERDQEWVDQLCEWLENEYNYKCCNHRRDFVVTREILDQISEAIDKSKRTLCVLSPSFLQSRYCMVEFKHALHLDVQMQKRRLIAIMLQDISDCTFDANTQIVQQYISQHTYLEASSPYFDDQLLYVLPVKKIHDEVLAGAEQQVEENNHHAEEGEQEYEEDSIHGEGSPLIC